MVITTSHPAENGIYLDVILARHVHTDAPFQWPFDSEASAESGDSFKRAVKLPIFWLFATLFPMDSSG